MTKHAYIPGDPWGICDVCGFKYRKSEMRRRWDGLTVCGPDWEPRHPQEAVRGRKDRILVDNPKPPPADVFIEPGDVTRDDL
ncbi:hypothetical protein [uncultured Paracoccus sp.]|uniref:hypothetical protein n=1 Tax=uncultured Paracoccus sp. TaxID=189685 RepID=UPI00261B5DBE|nr:hypothetical protein [uncultured Paracoccus sp.]